MKQEIIKIKLEGVNCYVVKAGEQYILIDTAGHTVLDKDFTNRREALEAELEKAGCTPENLKLIVLTHGDNDHVANADYLRSKYNAKIAMHQDDLELVESPTLELIMKSFNYKSLIYKIVFKLLNKQIKKTSEKTLDDFDAFTPDLYLANGDNLLEYGIDAKIIHLPGHTKGSIGILTSEGNLIAGDTFANVNKPVTAPNACSFEELKQSIKKIKDMPIATIYPGHGEPFCATEFKW